jgi:hypothetical protein
VGGRTAAAPQPAWRDLHQRYPGADGLGQRRRVAIRPPLGQGAAQVAERERFRREHLAGGGCELGLVQAGEVPAEGTLHAALDDRLH